MRVSSTSGAATSKGRVQARQQFAPIAGGGAQYQRAWQGWGFMHAPILLHCRHDQGILPDRLDIKAFAQAEAICRVMIRS